MVGYAALFCYFTTEAKLFASEKEEQCKKRSSDFIKIRPSKVTCSDEVEAGVEAVPCTACTLDDPNASHFGTRLRAYSLKTIINRFRDACTLSGFDSPAHLHRKQKHHPKWVVLSLWWRRGESNPRPKTYSHKLLRAQPDV